MKRLFLKLSNTTRKLIEQKPVVARATVFLLGLLVGAALFVLIHYDNPPKLEPLPPAPVAPEQPVQIDIN